MNFNTRAALVMRLIRQEKKISVLALFKLSGIDPAAYSRMENNKRAISLKNIESFCLATKTKPEKFFKSMFKD
jgi:transcriptional regulator with XRE-family HTH domain